VSLKFGGHKVVLAQDHKGKRCLKSVSKLQND